MQAQRRHVVWLMQEVEMSCMASAFALCVQVAAQRLYHMALFWGCEFL